MEADCELKLALEKTLQSRIEASFVDLFVHLLCARQQMVQVFRLSPSFSLL